MPWRDVGLAVVHRHLIGDQRFLLVDAQDGAVRHDAVQAVIGGAGGSDDHLAVALAEAGFFAQHQCIVVCKKSAPFGWATRQSEENIRDESGLLLDFQYLGLDVLWQIEYGGRGVTGRGGHGDGATMRRLGK